MSYCYYYPLSSSQYCEVIPTLLNSRTYIENKVYVTRVEGDSYIGI